jgi:hypothetical protein
LKEKRREAMGTVLAFPSPRNDSRGIEEINATIEKLETARNLSYLLSIVGFMLGTLPGVALSHIFAASISTLSVVGIIVGSALAAGAVGNMIARVWRNGCERRLRAMCRKYPEVVNGMEYVSLKNYTAR